MESAVQLNKLSCPRKKINITNLPQEILRRIAAFVTHDLFVDGVDNLYSALALSRTCKKFHKAVVQSNKYKLVLNIRHMNLQLFHMEALLQLFRRDVVQFQLDYDVDYIPSLRETPLYDNFKLHEKFIFSVLVAQTLRTAIIPDKAEYLDAIRKAKSLKSLFIRLQREPSQDIANTITSLELKHLSVSNEDFFKQCPGGYPCLINVFCFQGGLPMYRSKCSSIISIGFCCYCADRNHSSLASLLEGFPNLRDLQLSARIAPSVAPIFRHMNNVQLSNMDNIGEICETLGRSVTSVRTDAVLTCEEFRQLAQCQRLVVLKCRLGVGWGVSWESELNNALGSLLYLRSLQIRWSEPEGPNELLRVLSQYRDIYNLSPGTMYHVVRTTRLTHLEIGSVRISSRELLEIFKLMGSRAQQISVTRILIDDDTTFQAMIMLMDTAAMHNRNLRLLKLNILPGFEEMGLDEDISPYKDKLFQALDRIRSLIPWLKWEELKENVESLVNYACVMNEVFGTD